MNSGSKNVLELMMDEPEHIVRSLETMSGDRLIERLISSKKGIYKFFQMLKDENMVELYYSLL